MRAIYILVEGPTEEEFVNEILRPYLFEQEIYDVRAILMQTSIGHKGGDVSYSRLKNNVNNLLQSEGDIIVTSLIDFFRLKTDFPEYDNSLVIQDKVKRVSFLEACIADEINHCRFIPYIQLHEFEGLLFSSVIGFDYFPEIPEANRRELELAVDQYENPEFLNDGPHTAPSKRLERLIPGYRKTLHGPIIAHEITMPVILQKCKRFASWIEILVEKIKAH